MISNSYISIQDLFLLRLGKNKRVQQILFQFFKSNAAFLSPFKISPFMKELEEGPTSISRLRNKSVQGGNHSYQLCTSLGFRDRCRSFMALI